MRLLALPAPAAGLRLSVERFGPPGAASRARCSTQEPRRRRARARLREAVAQVRAVAGQEAALRAVCVDPDSRVPERRVVLAPDPASERPRARTCPRPGPRALRREDRPVEVDGEAVESLRESWLVEDRWWTAEPLRRRYWELVGVRGRNVVVFHDLGSGGWFLQGA